MIHKTLHIEDASVLLWEITESEAELTKLLVNFEIYEIEFNQLKTPKRRTEFLAARIALNTLVGFEVIITYTADGKPFCMDSNLKISISHSGKWVAVMLHPSKNVGIDIEIPTDRFLKLYRRFLTSKEQDTLFDAADLRKVQLAWSAKETLYKIIGNEAVNFDKHLEISDFKATETGNFTGVHIVSGTEYTLHYSATREYNLVYCIEN